jgi:D-alanine-D-alanine ligase
MVGILGTCDKVNKQELKGKRIGVLMGGMSAEREVSLLSGKAILEALLALGYDAWAVEADGQLAQRLIEKKIEVAFIGLHGRLGEDGAVQGLLEMMRIPYTGSGVLASALAMNKIVSRKIFTLHAVPVPPHIILKKAEREIFEESKLPFPLPIVVKPPQEGSSVGVSIVSEAGQIPGAIDGAFAYDAEILVEKYIAGREIAVGILDDVALGAIEIVPKVQFYSYQAKYTDGLAEHILPAPLPKDDYAQALNLGLTAHQLLGCEGATRVDMLYEEPGQFYVLEVNSLPGMTSLSLLPEIARGAGIDFPDLVERILIGARLKIPLTTQGMNSMPTSG